MIKFAGRWGRKGVNGVSGRDRENFIPRERSDIWTCFINRWWFVTGRLFAVPLLPVVFLSHFTPCLKANILTHLYTDSHNLTLLIIKLPATFRPPELPFSFNKTPAACGGAKERCKEMKWEREISIQLTNMLMMMQNYHVQPLNPVIHFSIIKSICDNVNYHSFQLLHFLKKINK